MIDQPEHPSARPDDEIDVPDAVHSPCTGLCDLDIVTRICRGCYRTLDEIMDWSRMSARERAGVIRLAGLRRAEG